MRSASFSGYPWSVPFIENAVWAAVYLLGSAIFWRVHPLAAGAYLVYSVSCMYLLVPRLVCTSCAYYGRTCHSAQGRIAALLFSPRDQREFPARFRYMRLAAPVFLFPVLAGAVLSVIRLSGTLAFSTLLFGVIALGFTRLVTTRLGCTRCEQRSVCPACHRTAPA